MSDYRRLQGIAWSSLGPYHQRNNILLFVSAYPGTGFRVAA